MQYGSVVVNERYGELMPKKTVKVLSVFQANDGFQNTTMNLQYIAQA
jgi:hypothetical protein